MEKAAARAVAAWVVARAAARAAVVKEAVATALRKEATQESAWTLIELRSREPLRGRPARLS